jgi:hypothetical protein
MGIGMQVRQEEFFKAVSEAKPYLDYVSLLTIHAIIAGLFFASLRLFVVGRSPERSLGIMAICLFLYWKLIPYLNRTNAALASMSLIKLTKLLRMPFPYGEVRSATVRWFVECYILLALAMVVLATGWVGYDIGQRTITAFGVPEFQSETKAPAKKVEPKVEASPPQP